MYSLFEPPLIVFRASSRWRIRHFTKHIVFKKAIIILLLLLSYMSNHKRILVWFIKLTTIYFRTSISITLKELRIHSYEYVLFTDCDQISVDKLYWKASIQLNCSYSILLSDCIFQITLTYLALNKNCLQFYSYVRTHYCVHRKLWKKVIHLLLVA